MVVDLSDLDFADISLMVDLATLSNRLRRRGRSLLLRGAKPPVLHLIEMVGLQRLPGVRFEDGVRVAI